MLSGYEYMVLVGDSEPTLPVCISGAEARVWLLAGAGETPLPRLRCGYHAKAGETPAPPSGASSPSQDLCASLGLRWHWLRAKRGGGKAKSEVRDGDT